MSPGGEYRERRARRSRRQAIRGVDYHVSEWGRHDDPLLVMLHGWGDAGSTFQFVVDELQDDWFVVAPDWRGFGESGHRAECYWFPDYLADLDRLLALYRPQQPVRLVGHSMGANVAALYAGIRPERVAALVNVEGFGLADSDPADAPGHYRRWLDRSREEQGFAGYASFDELLPRILKGSPRLSRERASFVARQWARESDGRVLIKADPAHRLPNAVQYRRAEAEACWAAIRAPVLLVTGADSDFNAAAKSWIDLKQHARAFRSAGTARIAECGHMVHFEQPARLARAIEAFLRDL